MQRTLRDILYDETIPFAEYAAILQRHSFKDARRARNAMLELRDMTGLANDEFFPVLVALVNVVSHSPDPDMAMVNIARYLETEEDKKAELMYLKERVNALSLLVSIVSFSAFFAEAIIARKGLFKTLVERHLGKTYTTDELALAFTEAQKEHEDARKAAHDFQLTHLLRIFANDITNTVDFVASTEEISNLADVIVTYFVNKRFEEENSSGILNDARLAVLAMGKLGGRELNYSSDIDLIVIYDTPSDAPNRQEAKAALIRALQAALKDLGDVAYGQALYRVDMRLRPEGSRGELIASFTAALNYYYSRGRTWERQAFIKARAMAGDIDLGTRFLAEMSAFIYKKYLTYDEIRDVKNLKRVMESRVRQEGKDLVEVKVGYGGIRDVEFTVQFYQILFGGQYQAIRTPNTLEGLRALLKTGLIGEEDAHTLREGYIFLREIEHRLQFYLQRQVHELPEDDEELLKVAMRMSVIREGGAKEFLRRYRETTNAIRAVFEKIFANLFTDNSFERYDIFFYFEEDAQTVTDALLPFGFNDPYKAYNALMQFSSDIAGAQKNYFVSALPSVLTEIRETRYPDETLTRLLSIVEAYGAKGTFFELLKDNKRLATLFVRIAGTSIYLSEILMQSPSFIDEIFYGNFIDASFTNAELKKVFDRIYAFYQSYPRAFYVFKRLEELRIGIKTLMGIDDVARAGKELSATADIVIAEAAKYVERGLPEPFPYAIIKLGKLGAEELNFGSDLDLVFAYKPIEGKTESAYYIDMFQKFLGALGNTEESGAVYAIDLRLRPFGGQSVIASTVDAFKEYYQTRADLWEKYAYTKMRVYANDGLFESDIADYMIRAVLAIDDEALKTDMAKMREKVVQAEKRKPGTWKFKKGDGSLFDIDVIVQRYIARALRAEGEFPEERPFEQMAEDGYLSSAIDALELKNAYSFFRNIELSLRMLNNHSLDALSPDTKEYEIASARMGYSGNDEGRARFANDYLLHQTNVRRIFMRFFS